jgi:hypothetical protein
MRTLLKVRLVFLCALRCTHVHALQGVFVPSQVAAASVLLSSSSNLQAVLCQFFREDLISWTSRKGKGAGGGSMQLPNDTLKGPVLRNTQQVTARVGGRGGDAADPTRGIPTLALPPHIVALRAWVRGDADGTEGCSRQQSSTVQRLLSWQQRLVTCLVHSVEDCRKGVDQLIITAMLCCSGD